MCKIVKEKRVTDCKDAGCANSSTWWKLTPEMRRAEAAQK